MILMLAVDMPVTFPLHSVGCCNEFTQNNIERWKRERRVTQQIANDCRNNNFPSQRYNKNPFTLNSDSIVNQLIIAVQ